MRRRRARAAPSLAALALVATAAAGSRPALVDRAAASGLDFVHFNGMTGKLYFPEMTGVGAAVLDYDGDGDLDLYMVQGSLLGGDQRHDALFPAAGEWPPVDRLFRNDLVVAPGGGVGFGFVDVTAASGIRSAGYGMGVAAGDYDRDGWVDLYVTNYGDNELFRNQGDGSFAAVTEAAGVGDSAWSSSAAFVDYDADGWLDLYVVNYVEFDVERNPNCFAPSSRRDYCGPDAFPPVADRLFRNRGDGTFEDVSVSSGLAAAKAPGLGVVAGDFDADGRLDLYVANDGKPNQLWVVDGSGRLRDEALFAGAAVNRFGRPEAGMGVVAEDLNDDGSEDLFLSHLTGETNTLYANQGDGLFVDRTVESGVGATSIPQTGFGVGVLDFDADGALDLFIANGAVKILEELAAAGDLLPLGQRNQLLANRGGGRFEDVSAAAGAALATVAVSRGVAAGDVDNDGDRDLLVANNNAAPQLLVDDDDPGHWLAAALAPGAGGERLHTLARVERGGAAPERRRFRRDGSYCSSNDARIQIGLGGDGAVTLLAVEAPGGGRRVWRAPPTGRYLVLPF